MSLRFGEYISGLSSFYTVLIDLATFIRTYSVTMTLEKSAMKQTAGVNETRRTVSSIEGNYFGNR